MNRIIIPVLFVFIIVFSSCTMVTTRDMIEQKAANQSKNNIPLYFGAAEVPQAYEVLAEVHWVRMSMLSGKKKIGKKALQKADKYLNKGVFDKIDAVLIGDMFDAKFIRFTGKKTSMLEPGIDSPPSNSPPSKKKTVEVKERDFSSPYIFPNSPQKPAFRVGGWAGISNYSRRNSTFFLSGQGAYRLASKPNIEVGPEIALHLPRQNITKIQLNVQARHFFDLLERKVFTVPLRPFVLLELNNGLVLGDDYQNKDGEWKKNALRIGLGFGLGTEYRLSENLMAFIESKVILHGQNYRNGFQFGVGVRRWLK